MTGEDRRIIRRWPEIMHVSRSRLHDEVQAELNRHSRFPLTDKHFCVASTAPDFYFPDEQVAVYLDGEKVHAKRPERDRELRLLLARHYHIKVVSIPYEKFGAKKVVETVDEILEALR